MVVLVVMGLGGIMAGEAWPERDGDARALVSLRRRVVLSSLGGCVACFASCLEPSCLLLSQWTLRPTSRADLFGKSAAIFT